MQLIGQKNNLNIIDTWKDFPSFLIIQGAPHTGKKYFLLYLCKKFGLKYSSVKNAVKNVRQILQYMSPNSNMVFHLDDFDNASLAAKNSLLKITEEPMPGNYIAITGGPQIKTLQSRAKRIVMEPYTLQEMQTYMSSIWNDSTLTQNLYIAGLNTPAKVQMYKDYEALTGLLNYTQEIFNHITYISKENIISMLGRFEDRYDRIKDDDGKARIDACMLFLDMLINTIQYNIHQKKLYSYFDILDILLNAKMQLQKEPTLRRKMLLFKTFAEIEQLQRSEVQ